MKILYLSHIRWGWIKQRPHFLAEGLAKNNKVDCYYYQGLSYKESDDYTPQTTNGIGNLSLNTFWLLPFRWIPIIRNIRILEKVNWWFFRRQLPKFGNYDIIWITSPIFYMQIKSSLKKSNIIVYDCMDDMIAFPDVKNNKNKVRLTLRSEHEILSLKNSVVFCSSDYLAKTILKRAGLSKKLVVVNNAIELPKKTGSRLGNMPAETRTKYDKISRLTNVFMYIGTISEWFDFDKIVRLTKDIPSLNVVLVGPYGSLKIPKSPQIHAVGPINRDYIFDFMEVSKALIMPFVVNDLIESVNPVKLYEYIYSGKPSIASYYSESEKFKDYVCLYKDYDELMQIATGIIEGTISSRSRAAIDSFISQNSWEERLSVIEDNL